MPNACKSWLLVMLVAAVCRPIASAQLVPELATFKGHQTPIVNLAFSLDGRMLASATREGPIKVWEVTTGRERLSLESGDNSPTLQFAANGTLLSSDGAVRVFQVYSGAEPQVQSCLEPASGISAFSPDNSTVAVMPHGSSGRIAVWERATGKILHHLSVPNPAGAKALALSPYTRLLAAANVRQDHGEVYLWQLATGQPPAILEGLSFALAFSPDGRRLATACLDGEARVWDCATAKRLKSFRVAMDESVMSIAFSPDGNTLAAGCSDHTVWLWNVATGRELVKLGHVEAVVSLAFSKDGNTLAAGSGNWFATKNRSEIKLWDVSKLRNP